MAKRRNTSSEVIITNQGINLVLLLITLAAAILCAFGIYYKFFTPEPKSFVSAYVTTLNLAEEQEHEVYAMEFNIFTNKDHTENGIAVAEMMLGSYRDPNAQSISYAGIQAKGLFIPTIITDSKLGWWSTTHYTSATNKINYNDKAKAYKAAGFEFTEKAPNANGGVGAKFIDNTVEANDIYTYNVSEKSFTAFSNEDFKNLRVNIGEEIFQLNFKGLATAKPSKKASLGWRDHYKTTYDAMYMFSVMYNSILSLGAGEHVVTMNLSEFFYIEKWDGNTFKLVEGDYQKLYIKVKATVSDKGLLKASESLFDKVGDDDKYNQTGETPETFWKAKTNITLTVDDFNKRQSNSYGGSLGTIKAATAERLLKYEDLLLRLKVDVAELIGLDYYSFSTLKIESIEITNLAGTPVRFYCLKNALLSTGVKQIKHAGTVELVITDEITFEEVVA